MSAMGPPPSVAVCAATTESVGGRQRSLGVTHLSALLSLLCSDLADMGLQHCRFVTRRPDAERLHNLPITPQQQTFGP